MLARAISRALQQMGDPAFRRVIVIGVALAVAAFVALGVLIFYLAPMLATTGIGWLDGALELAAIPAFLVIIYFLFPAVATMFMSLFLDDIVDAVEARHYSDGKGWRKSPIIEAVWLAVRLGLILIAVNLLLLPVYIVLLFTAIGPLILYFVVNAWLLGREYFELVAVRHGSVKEASRLRKLHRDRALMGGAVVAGLFMIPIVNLLAPVLGAAVMVHLFHGAGARSVKAA